MQMRKRTRLAFERESEKKVKYNGEMIFLSKTSKRAIKMIQLKHTSSEHIQNLRRGNFKYLGTLLY